MIYIVSYFFFRVLSGLFFPATVIGRERLPVDQGFVIASNHISNLDPFILGISSGRRLSYVTKDSLFKNKIVGFFLPKVDAFPIKRGASDFRAMREILRRLKQNRPVVLFPEGTRKGAGKENRIHPGIGFVAAKSGAPVVPAYIKDSDKVMPPGAKMLRRHPVRVTFGDPLYFTADQSYIEISRHIMDKIVLLAQSSRPAKMGQGKQ